MPCQASTRYWNYLEVYWSCAGGLSAVNAIGTQLRASINSGLTRWRMAVPNKYMDAAAEFGRNPVRKHQIQPEYGDEQADARRDCRAHLPSRETKLSGANEDREVLIIPVQLITSRIDNLIRFIHCCCLHITSRSDLYSVLSNIRTGQTDADAFRGHRLTTQKGYTLKLKDPEKSTRTRQLEKKKRKKE